MNTIKDTKFSDIYITEEDNKAYIPDARTHSALIEFNPDDYAQFFEVVKSEYDGKDPSYPVFYDGVNFRAERSETSQGTLYCLRRMPEVVPPIKALGYPPELINYMMSLRRSSGLILCAGATGSGKTTFISSLLKEYLTEEGGFAYTIENPAEHPLSGVYKARNGGLGVCRQTMPINNNWGDSLKSALRSAPRYIMVGEIRTPDAADELLRASVSGHLVFSTIHANNCVDALSSLVKYASASSMSEELAYDMLSRGLLSVIHQTLMGKGVKKPSVQFLMANPNTSRGDQVRGIIKTGNLNLATTIEQQMIRMARNQDLFPDVS